MVMKKKILWVLFLSIIVHAGGFAQSDSDDGDECEQCQVCFGTQDLRQVCECLKHICLTCLEGWEKSKASHETSISCPNCRRPWLRTDVKAILAPRAAMRRLIAEETSARNRLEFLEQRERPNRSTNLSPVSHRTWDCWVERPVWVIRDGDPTPIPFFRDDIAALRFFVTQDLHNNEHSVTQPNQGTSLRPMDWLPTSLAITTRAETSSEEEGERMPSGATATNMYRPRNADFQWLPEERPAEAVPSQPERNLQTANEQNNTRQTQDLSEVSRQRVQTVYAFSSGLNLRF